VFALARADRVESVSALASPSAYSFRSAKYALNRD